MDDFRRAWALRHVWFHQAYHAVSAKYRRSVLGPFWMAGSMVATSLALAIVFGGIFGQPLRETLPYIMSGILVWAIVSMPLVDGPESFVVYANTIKTNNFPFMYYIFEGICKNFIIFLHNLLVFFLMLFLLGVFAGVHWSFLLAVPIVLVTLSFYESLVGMLAARYRDIRFLFPYISQVIFFVTPIFWDPKTLHGPRRAIVDFNPFYYLIEITRNPLLGMAPSPSDWMMAFVILGTGAILWLLSFTFYRRRIPFWV